MIEIFEDLYCLSTKNTSLLLEKTPYGHLSLLHYGVRVEPEDGAALNVKNTAPYGSSVMYDENDPLYCLDTMPLAWSGTGRGDYRESPIELETSSGRTTDFCVVCCEEMNGIAPMAALPQAQGADQTLAVSLVDKTTGAELTLYFSVFEAADVITRRSILKNSGKSAMVLHKLMSGMMDLPGEYILTTFDGGWIREAHRHDVPVGEARVVNGSSTGSSSNRHNPGFLLHESAATEDHGCVYGFNLVWSGNHYASAQRSLQGLTRVMQGFSPENFHKRLEPGEQWETPEAVMSFSRSGFNGLSAHMHDFVNRHIIPVSWRGKPRPVLYNSWEGCGFAISERRLLEQAKKAAKLGCELFVLDDGWFGARSGDHAGLGDYTVNKKKLPGGLAGLGSRLKKLGLSFGLWFEPEAVNPDSDLYRAHPDWVQNDPGRDPVYGRSELLLDLTNPAVRSYITRNVTNVLNSADISYVKWDMNRHSTLSGLAAYENTLGLYDILGRIFSRRPEVLLETCSSGGNRFDLGMLCFGAQIWASDDTDPIERLDIQNGLSYLYPLSTMGSHVSASPHQQTLRQTPLSTRGNVSFFGILGYELDLKYLTAVDENDIREQIEFYKRYRALFQYGRFFRLPAPEGQTRWQVGFGDAAVEGVFYRLSHAAPGAERLQVRGLNEGSRYRVAARPQNLRVGDFGELVRYVAPMKLNPHGLVLNAADRLYFMADCAETVDAGGAALTSGVSLNNRFNGTGYSEIIRMLGDFGSGVYVIHEIRRGEAAK